MRAHVAYARHVRWCKYTDMNMLAHEHNHRFDRVWHGIFMRVAARFQGCLETLARAGACFCLWGELTREHMYTFVRGILVYLVDKP